MRKYKLGIFTGFFASVILSGCGGGGYGGSDNNYDDGSNNNNNSMPQISAGVLVDSPVSGMHYVTATQSGQTDAQGMFSYISGENITFSIGDINFPTIMSAATITPFDLAGTLDTGDIALINMVRLIQTLDTDGDESNGISISAAAHLAATGATVAFDSPTFDTDMDVVNLVANSGSVNVTLIDGVTAIANLTANVNPETACTKLHPSVGYKANLMMRAHNVSGMTEIVDDCTIKISGFNYDGGGLPDVRIYAGLNGNYTNGFSLGENIFGTVHAGDTLTITLPAGRTLDEVDGISIWCVQAKVSFGDGQFQAP